VEPSGAGGALDLAARHGLRVGRIRTHAERDDVGLLPVALRQTRLPCR
jgi:hypothetical protein